jgi:hypothetical protein
LEDLVKLNHEQPKSLYAFNNDYGIELKSNQVVSFHNIDISLDKKVKKT